MRAKVKFALHVKQDIKQATTWYNQAQKGLGTRFFKNIKEEINFIANQPECFQIRYETIHVAVIKIFPYTIHYQFLKSENTIIILGVFHTSIHPEKWTKRL
ncbi:hypothetical protein FFWV33_10585 [Flavobacterium faecale]|uniref:Plasmid stabilization system n=1 Tax=Flavobacterium faecale TaxID=1355330 RepID=A0A2S1LDW2_9FLAO|nr:type II toxin-antitoxin system RelE/ParE family toxin [Flavobacterium faecale]AWG21939.1 hypothetical protein FFWV33_10585 [Flavobacterium faecale]